MDEENEIALGLLLSEAMLLDREQVEKKFNFLDLNQKISSIVSDSREVRAHCLFIAIRGTERNGNQFVKEAVQKGAVLIIGDDSTIPWVEGIPYIYEKNPRKMLAAFSASFYRNPSLSMLLVGITGTSGKTTTSYLIESIFKAAGLKVGVIGTINARVDSFLFPVMHTTPPPQELQCLLAKMKEKGCDAVVMEVSSHALKQQRVACIAFDSVVFTNLSPEHLDYHLDMEDYFQSKSLLFKECAGWSLKHGKKTKGIIYTDDPYGARLAKEVSSLSFPVSENKNQKEHLEIFSYSLKKHRLQFHLNTIKGTAYGIPIASSLIGTFNGCNLLAALQVSLCLGISDSKIAQGIKNLKGVPGRLEKILNSKGIHIWIDYAHKPDALQQVLFTLSQLREQVGLKDSQIITVFGCGGDRDRGKRPIMGRFAVENSDQVIITSDNPRSEDPLVIIEEVVSEVKGNPKVEIEVDRKKAIFLAIRKAKKGDFVLIAGKGHETYQWIGNKKVPMDDRELVKEAFYEPMLDMGF